MKRLHSLLTPSGYRSSRQKEALCGGSTTTASVDSKPSSRLSLGRSCPLVSSVCFVTNCAFQKPVPMEVGPFRQRQVATLPHKPVTPSTTGESVQRARHVNTSTSADIVTSAATLSSNAENMPKLPLFQSVNSSRLSHYLSGFDSVSKSFLVDGFSFGFRLPCSLTTPPPSTSYTNHPSVTQNPAVIAAKLSYELSLGRIAGPFSSPPFPNFITSPLGLVPKRNSSDFRIIHDLSFPLNNSVNSHIDQGLKSVSYETLDVCIEILLSIGKGALIAKADLKEAFRIIPIHPEDYRLLGFQWDGNYYFDKCLPMGCGLSCSIFETFSSSLQWILQSKFQVLAMSHILDDFIFFGPPDSPVCNRSLHSFLCLCESLSLPVKHEKTVHPSTCVILHGIEVDTATLMLKLPQDKLEEAQDKVSALSKRKRVTLRELQSVLGTLSFACRAIVPGRAFLRRLFSLTRGVSLPSHHIRLTREARLDLAAWSLFLRSFNGRVMCLPAVWESSDTLKLFSDASGKSFAAVLGSSWFSGDFPASWANVNIAVKELLPIEVALQLWGPRLANKRVLFITDNLAIVSVINSLSSKDPRIMSLVRSLVSSMLTFNTLFKAKHIPGKSNLIADLLSRNQIQKALQLAPWLDEVPLQVPTSYLPW